MVLNAVDGIGSDEIRNQVAGHLESRTYRMYYQDQNISLDVANIVRGQPTEDALLRKLNSMGANKDPNANVALPPGFNEEVAALPDVVALETECRTLTESIKDKYGYVSAAPGSDPLMIRRKEAQRKHRAKKQFYKTRMLKELRQDYFIRADDAAIEAPCNDGGELSVVLPVNTLDTNLIPERAHLADFVGIEDPRTSSRRADAVQIMFSLCSRVEPNRSFARMRSPSPLTAEDPPADTAKNVTLPMQCHPLQCLFCLGDERLLRRDRIKTFNRLQALWDHARVHLDAIDLSHEFCCPHPVCKAETADSTR